MKITRAAHLSEYTGTIDRIHTEVFFPNTPFMAIAEKFSALDGTVVLMSGGDGDCARHHILAAIPLSWSQTPLIS
jgi:para-aminobenzoate synthetase component I